MTAGSRTELYRSSDPGLLGPALDHNIIGKSTSSTLYRINEKNRKINTLDILSPSTTAVI